MRTIYLLRHGEPDFPNGRRCCIGRLDPPLSSKGREQAETLAAYFRGKALSGIFCSSLRRSRQTAEILSRKRYPVTMIEGFEELHMGDWDGLSFASIRKLYPEKYRRRGERPDVVSPPDGENFHDGARRFCRAFSELSGRIQGDLVIVAHAGVNRAFLCLILGKRLRQSLTLPQPCGCINLIQENDGSFHAIQVGLMPDPVPNEKKCLSLLAEYGTPASIIAHCRAAAQKACRIADVLIENGCFLDRDIVFAAAMLHDIAKRSPGHATAGAEWLNKKGYSRISRIIQSHHHLEESDLQNITESTVVFLADKQIRGVTEVSLEERFAESLSRCDSSAARLAHRLQYEQAAKALALVLTVTGKEMSDAAVF